MSLLITTIHLPCGASADLDYSSGIGYRCTSCGAVVGSIGQPKDCQDADQKYQVLEKLGGSGHWDYEKGKFVISK